VRWTKRILRHSPCIGRLAGCREDRTTRAPLAIDLFCGLGGWTEGLLAEGYRVVGFDNMQHVYGEARYPGQLVIQDVLTLHGSQFKDAALIVASPPCQAYSYRAMPWKKAKALPPPDNALFEACFRIQREAEDAADGPIPMVVENVCGAQKWVGRARWHYGSFYLWGDVPALMPIVRKHVKVPTMGAGWYHPDHPKHVRGLAFNGHADRNLRATKNDGGSWFGAGADCSLQRRAGSRSARQAASAHIAKIPYELSRWIGRAWKTADCSGGGRPETDK
jgi:hypothetical protein